MRDIPRRTLQELVSRYQLEPSIRDLFVEGAFDASAMKKFAREMNLGFSVYEIDSIECSAEQLGELELPDNTRSRVIWLAQRLAQSLGHDYPGVRCVADTDYDQLLEISWDCGLLFFTDVSSMEVYVFSNSVAGHMLPECVGVSIDCAALMDSMRPTLKQLFTARAANVKLRWGMKWLPPWKCIRVEKASTELTFDYAEFERRYLNKNQRAGRIAEFQQCVSELRQKSNSESIRGHDAFELLARWLKKQNVAAKFCDHDVLLAIAIGYSTSSCLAEFPLFRRITEWCTKAIAKSSATALL